MMMLMTFYAIQSFRFFYFENNEIIMAALDDANTLSVSQDAKRLKNNEGDVIAAYALGSRFWGTANSASDWDLLLVHSDSKRPGNQALHSGQDLDVTAIHKDEFVGRVKEHKFTEIVTLWAATLGCSSRSKEMNPRQILGGKIDSKKLALSVLEEADRDWRVSKKFADKNDGIKAVRVASHSVRMMMTSVAICKTGTLSQTVKLEANDAVTEIRALGNDVSTSGWNILETAIVPRVAALRTELEQIARLDQRQSLKTIN